MKKILIAILLLSLTSTGYAIDYNTATPYELKKRVAHLITDLISEKQARKQDQDTIITQARTIQRLADEKNNLIATTIFLQGEIIRLHRLLEFPYRAGDLAFDLRLSVGLGLTIGAIPKIYIWRGMYGFIEAGASYGYLWKEFNKLPMFMGGVGLGYSW